MPIWNKDDSVTLTREDVQQLAEILTEWGEWSGWTQRGDCQGWDTDIDARENRRESITFKACMNSIKSWIGRREISKVMDS